MVRRFFLKRLRAYFYTLLLPTSLVYLMAIAFLTVSAQATLREEAAQALLVTGNNLDLIISNAVYQNNMMTSNPSFVLTLRKLLAQDEISYYDLGFTRSIKTAMTSIVGAYEYVDSIYLFLDGYDKFLTSQTGIEPILNHPDPGWYEAIRTKTLAGMDADCWVENRVAYKTKYTAGKNYLTIYRRMAYVDGYIVVNIDQEKFLRIIDAIFARSDMTFLLLDDGGNILVSSTAGALLSEAKRTDLSTTFAARSPQGEWLQADGKPVMIHTVENPEYGLKLAAVTAPAALWVHLRTPFGILMISVLANLVLMLIVATSVTRRNFRQINDIIRTFDQAEKGVFPTQSADGAARDEYDLILNNVIHLFLNTTLLNSQLEQRRYREQVAEMTALQTQINPHFLFNTLQTLDFEVQRANGGRPSDASGIIRKLSDMLAYALRPTIELVTVEQEIDALKKYVEIQRYRFSQRLIVYYQVEDSVWALPCLRLILQPLVENSLLHGLRGQEREGCVKVKASRCAQGIWFRVIDNGCGMSRMELDALRRHLSEEDATGIGLSNVHQRLTLSHGSAAGLVIRSRSGMGTCVSFRLPL